MSEKETEIKIRLEDPEKIKNKLLKIAEVEFRDNFQRTRHLDTPQEDLISDNIFLRTREEEECDITTVKTGNSEDLEYFQRDEIEVEVSDAKRMAEILKTIGFTRERILEKKRTVFSNDDLEFCVDETPIGDFLEIEGPIESIEDAIKKLGLGRNERIDTHYWEVNRRYCKENAMEETKHIVFDESPIENKPL